MLRWAALERTIKLQLFVLLEGIYYVNGQDGQDDT